MMPMSPKCVFLLAFLLLVAADFDVGLVDWSNLDVVAKKLEFPVHIF